ncbi:AI-2E family transporter [Oricola cellulosilytica]|uniref:AI-2E family transporter n=1 Tax=Oricola cellulosilytica TaxID=1429082 RepID=A0A4R0PBJ5_9HYPH|nr:AI-2E family transporter [Oricola cellulosilytica]TCD12317.1 AI-2E family transporter [Oricola cellulosilytica]
MQAYDRFRNFVYGMALAIMIGWILHVGRNVFVPVIASVILAYIVVALARRMYQLPLVGHILPGPVRYTISILIIAFIVVAFVFLIISNINQVIALVPQYQVSLLRIIQGLAVQFGFETEPTWATIRRDVFGEIRLQSLIGSTVTSISVLVGSVFVVVVYTGFALAERQLFARKLSRLSSDPADSALIAQIVNTINDRIGDYLAAKTFVNLVLGLISYVVMIFIGLDFAAFWGVLIALLNYIPYIGSMGGVLFPTAIAIVQFEGDWSMIATAFVGLTICQIFVGSFLEPSLMGRQLNLSPFVILVSLTSWGMLWGIPGALLSVPVTAIMVIVFSEFEGTRPIAILLSRSGRIPPQRHKVIRKLVETDGAYTIEPDKEDDEDI